MPIFTAQSLENWIQISVFSWNVNPDLKFTFFNRRRSAIITNKQAMEFSVILRWKMHTLNSYFALNKAHLIRWWKRAFTQKKYLSVFSWTKINNIDGCYFNANVYRKKYIFISFLWGKLTWPIQHDLMNMTKIWGTWPKNFRMMNINFWIWPKI